MKPTPPGWPRISAALYYTDPAKAIDWLCTAFGFEVRLKVEGADGRIEHSELEFGEGLIMVAGAGPRYTGPETPWKEKCTSPASIDGRMTQNLALYVDDVDAHCAHARKHGAKVMYEPKTTDYGGDYWADRNYAALDPEGHMWWFMQRLRTGGQKGDDR
jgi:uncharacterized glyoxalase superfamily protein PhnB